MRTIYPTMEIDSVSRFNWQKIARTSPFVAILLIWFGAAAFGVTNSSLKLNFATAEKNSAKIIIGTPRSIRGDEWVRATPYAIGRIQPGWSQNHRSPLEAGNENKSAKLVDSIEKAVFFEGTVLEKTKSFKAFE